MESQVSLVDAPFGSFRILFGPLKIDLFSVTHPDQALKERRMRQRETKKNCSHTWVLPHDATSGPCPKRRCTVSLSLRGLERRVWVATTKRLLGSLESYENTFTVYYFFLHLNLLVFALCRWGSIWSTMQTQSLSNAEQASLICSLTRNHCGARVCGCVEQMEWMAGCGQQMI
jgi:hypothetical protein